MSNYMKIYIDGTHNPGYISLNGTFLQKQVIKLRQYQVIFDTAAHALASGCLILNIDSCITGKNFVSGFSWQSSKSDKYSTEDQTSIFLPLDNNEITNKVCDIDIDLANDLREDNKFSISSTLDDITGLQSVILIFSFDYEAI